MKTKKDITLDLNALPTYITFNLTATINTGNYESVKINYGITAPVINEDLKKATEKIKKLVKEQMAKEVESVRKEVNGK